jgi:hypothetical protein
MARISLCVNGGIDLLDQWHTNRNGAGLRGILITLMI